MYVLTVTIGRNIGNDPMRRKDWEQFATGVWSIVASATDSRPEVHTGTGMWGEITEESMMITGLSDSPIDLAAHNVRGSLASLALTYGQDAIALTLGESDLIFPSRY